MPYGNLAEPALAWAGCSEDACGAHGCNTLDR